MEDIPKGDQRVLSTLNADGTRRWLDPRLSKGRWLNRRRVVGYALIVIFVALPHLRIAGKPPLLLDIARREFTFFGTTLYPTDTLLLALMLLTVALGIFFFTAMFGRIWCGWACPQTVYMELVFRPIERLFTGKKNKFGPAGPALRFLTFLLLSFALANTFLAYFVGTDALRQWVFGSPLGHPIAFLLVIATTLLMLFDFGFFREQMCIVACPYGRFQSVMLDKDSLIVGYDTIRGEPRGKQRRSAAHTEGGVSLKVVNEPAQGDCIDCTLCVQTCPTGIDIRDGLQLECVNCTQCIDACDEVMTRIGKPTGLIRFASQRELNEGKRRFMRPRVFVYPTIILVLVSVMIGLLATRAPALVRVLRGPGAPFNVLDSGLVTNTVQIKLHDRTGKGGDYTLSLVGVEGASLTGGDTDVPLAPGEMHTSQLLLTVPPQAFTKRVIDVAIRVEGEGFDREVPYRMIGPIYRPEHATHDADDDTPGATHAEPQESTDGGDDDAG